MITNEPTNCDTCQASLERGYNYLYKEDKIVKATCFDCNRKDILQEYIKTKRLSARLIQDNMMFLYDVDMKKDWHFDKNYFLEELKTRIDIQLSYSRIFNFIKEFESEVWFKGLQAQVKASQVKGVSARTKVFDNFCVLTYSMCGRTMITIETDKESVTLITAEDSSESVMGFQGIDASEHEAVSLIQLAIELYHNEGGPRLEFKDDDKVSMGF